MIHGPKKEETKGTKISTAPLFITGVSTCGILYFVCKDRMLGHLCLGLSSCYYPNHPIQISACCSVEETILVKSAGQKTQTYRENK